MARQLRLEFAGALDHWEFSERSVFVNTDRDSAMDIKVRINESEERVWGDGATTSWINEQIGARLEAGVSVCVVVTVNGDGVRSLRFSAGECGSSGGGSGTSSFNGDEQRVIGIWERIGVQETPVNAGKLTAFIQQVSRC